MKLGLILFIGLMLVGMAGADSGSITFRPGAGLTMDATTPGNVEMCGGRIESIETANGYQIIVYKDGSDVIAEWQNGTELYRGTSNTNDATAINAAIDNLTSERDWKEIVVLSGSFQLENNILLKNYTILDATGSQIDLYANDYMLTTENNITHSTVKGGKWNGRYTDVTGTAGINFNTSQHCSVEDLQVYNTELQGIVLNYGGTYGLVKNCLVDNAQNDGIVINGMTYADLINCHARACNHTGINIYDGANMITVSGGTSSLNGMSGYGVESATSQSKYVFFQGCKSVGNTLNGFITATTGGGDAPRHISIIGCLIVSNTLDGILVQGGWYHTVSGCQIESSGNDGIEVQASTLNTIIGNNIVTNAGYGINETSTADYTFSADNVLWGNTAGGSTVDAANSETNHDHSS